ncbi:unnamed protein product, partial [Rotaria sp. Silwood2]
MLDFCRHYYRGNSKQQKLIDEFEDTYRPEDAILWYSKQSFIYKLVNKALRCEDTDLLHTFRFFIGDLSESLAREHKKILRSDDRILKVYRGVKLSNEELDKLRNSEGKLISTNGFLSTSRLRQPALVFASKLTKRKNVVPVLFQIKLDVQQLGESISFADIAKFSQYPNEQEVLFNFSAAFRIETIQQDGPVWLINMNASKDGETITHDYIELTRQETEEKTVSIMLGRLMCDMGQYDKSQKYFEQLLLEANGEDVASIELNIGRDLYFKADWEPALDYCNRAYKRMINTDPPCIKESAYVLDNIGAVF